MEKINVLKIIVENINMFEENKLEIDFTNDQQISNHDNDHPYYNVKSSIYLPRVLAFNGVNASGKTTVLEIIDFMFSIYINRENLNRVRNRNVINKIIKDDYIKTTFFYEFKSTIYKVESKIGKETIDQRDDYEPLINNGYKFINELIYKKNLNNSTPKNLLYYKGYTLIYNRNELDNKLTTFLEDSYSMIAILKHKTNQIITRSLQSDRNVLNRMLLDRELQLDHNIIQYLDPSIKSIKKLTIENSAKPISYFEIIFKTGKVIEATEFQLELYLSSGTSRGLKLLNTIKRVLKTGGYFILDELEIHFNKTIANDIIRLFLDYKTNPNNATLFFSTHYTELIDTLDRNDQVVLIHRNENYEIKLSKISKFDRDNQNKKSESYFSDEYEIGTAIEYETYLSFRKTFKNNGED